MSQRPAADDFLTIGPRIRVLPIIHGSGDFAVRVREELLSRPYDCVAVPLPPSFQDDVEEAIERLPAISVVAQLDADRDDAETGFSYVPIDPCQGVIAALRTALGERIARAFIDMETPRFEAHTAVFPDPYALKRVSPDGFAAAVLPAIPPPRPGQHADADRLDGRAAPRAGGAASRRSCSSARCWTGPGSATPTSAARARPSPTRSSRRSRPSASTPRR